MSLRVIKPGILDSIQDAGRVGYRHLGINPSGAMDPHAMRVANILVGNEPGTPVIEMHFPASAFFFEQPAMIAISGADFQPMLNGEVLPMLQPVLVSKFAILQFESPRYGARAYLAIRGGLHTTPWLNSHSTHLKALSGGLDGRMLRKDDLVGFSLPGTAFIDMLGQKEFHVLPWKADDQWQEGKTTEILVLPGREWDLLTPASKELFLHQPFMIAPNSDRMGYRLTAALLQMDSTKEIISSAVNVGTVQLLPDGRLILLMADHQTTGGYPRVAHVVTAHLGKLAQLKAGDPIWFKFTDQKTAEEMMLRQHRHLQQLEYACSLKFQL